MGRCKCGSYALNDAPESGLCDVCYQKARVAALEAERDALRERCEKLEAALGEIGGSEERICNYCEGEGNRYADGKAHYYSEHAPTILCPECGGRGRIRDMDSEDMAAVANAALATEVKP